MIAQFTDGGRKEFGAGGMLHGAAERRLQCVKKRR